MPIVIGFLYSNRYDEDRDETVCQIVRRAPVVDEGFGIEPRFLVRFADGVTREVIAQQLTPWYPT